MNLEEPEAKNDCAGEDQQLFDRLTDRLETNLPLVIT
jgi:hypothetical protein